MGSFATRNLYRSAIEQLARGSGLAEIDIARSVMHRMAGTPAAASGTEDKQSQDPGYVPLAAGRDAFEREIGFRPAFRASLARLNDSVGIGGYTRK